MKSFKFKYSTAVWVLLFLVLILSAVGICWNVFNLITFFNESTFKAVSYSLIILLTAFMLVFVLSVIFYGKYAIKDGFLVQYFGFLKTKTPISEIVEITHFKKSDKLVVYFADQKYTVIVISPEFYEQFILAIRKVNPKIGYDVKIEGEDVPKN
ncbi:MAG: PH domain-containing protein [Clostridia bacterium]|nr:PH domain-containing protein [Clostridia bacterium]